MHTDLRAQLQESLGDAYTIEHELGGGGMARVFLATEVRFVRQVVVKLLSPELMEELSVERFKREVLLAAQLQQANIVPVFSAGECGGVPYYLMPFIDGESLRLRMQRGGALGISETVGILRDVARALAYAHERGIVHRDIKPENVLLSGSAAVVSDFGIAKAVQSARSQASHMMLTAAGTNVGTPAYMAPEQVVGDDVDARADVYAWGLMAYEMLAGQHPYSTKATLQDMATAHLTEMLTPIGELRPDTPDALARLIMQSLNKARTDRPNDGSVLIQAIDDVTVLATPTPVNSPASVVTVGAQRVPDRRRAPTPITEVSIVAAPPPAGPRHLSTRLMRSAVVLTVVLALAIVAYLRRDRIETASVRDAASIAPDKSIAVLPFVNMSGDKEQDYFSDGITEELINLLAKSNDLRVAARTSAFKFKDVKLDVKEVARQLNVGYVLEGSVRKSGNVIRVTAQLIKASDGFPMWSESYDRKLDDIFAVQDEICDKAVKALQATLLGGAALASGTKLRNPDAYNLVLQGRHFLEDRTTENITRAIGYFQQALALDSTNAAAYAGLARAYTVQAGQGWMPVADGYNQSRNAATKAIALDPQLAEGWVALGYVQNIYDWNWSAADSSYRKALALEPGNAETMRTAALLAAKLGRTDDAIRMLRQAIERDPLLAGAYSALAFMLDATGRSAEAEPPARKALELGPTGILRHFNIARALVFQGKNEAALAEIEQEKGESWRLMGLAIVDHALHRKAESDKALAEYSEKNASHAAMQIADVHAFRGEKDEAFVWLERAFAQHDAGIADIKDDPWLKSIRGDARYGALLKKVRLPE